MIPPSPTGDDEDGGGCGGCMLTAVMLLVGFVMILAMPELAGLVIPGMVIVAGAMAGGSIVK